MLSNKPNTELNLAILHWSPIEIYPPATNLVRCLSSNGALQLTIHTMEDYSARSAFFSPGCLIFRNPSPVGKSAWRRMIAYFWYHGATFIRLMREKPDAVLYIEPSSAFPVYLHSLLRPGVPIFIHHHEYHSPDQFLRPGMRLVRWFHRLEKKRLLPRARWVSHTNAKRMELFCQDCPMVPTQVRRILPNYPPAAWGDETNIVWDSTEGPFRFVYVGSLSRRDTFLEAFVRWLTTLPAGSVQFDVYAYNLDAPTREFLIANQGEVLRFFPKGVDYDQLPGVLRNYHVGVILYRAETLNYRYNETNKLFEYLVCGLDVWYSHRMQGIKPHARTEVRPRVIECDFENMALRDWREYMARPCGLPLEVVPQDSESACTVLEAAILEAIQHGGLLPKA
jgi:hypothetical protein